MNRIKSSTQLLAVFLFALPTLSVQAASSRLFGDWKTADGSVVRTAPCAQALCITILAVPPSAPGTQDHNNPVAALRTRSLCHLEIGSNFTLAGDNRATDGRLYDPESGKTYKGNIELQGDTLKLRGYIGVTLFGRTEIWHRTSEAKACS
ncbi:MAG: DUF2147 domain-containing protein [Acidobacteriaceae bacterium]